MTSTGGVRDPEKGKGSLYVLVDKILKHKSVADTTKYHSVRKNTLENLHTLIEEVQKGKHVLEGY